MTKYSVTVTRKTREATEVDIEAGSIYEALTAATKQAESDASKYQWDWCESVFEATDIEEIEEDERASDAA